MSTPGPQDSPHRVGSGSGTGPLDFESPGPVPDPKTLESRGPVPDAETQPNDIPRCLTTCTLMDCLFSLYSHVHLTLKDSENMENTDLYLYMESQATKKFRQFSTSTEFFKF